MNIGDKPVKVFKMRNRSGYAAICEDCITEGSTQEQAFDRMVKAINRVERKILKR